MTNRTAAIRYARALFDVVRNADPVRTDDDLRAFATLVTRHPELARALASPALPPAAKQRIVGELLRRQPLSDPVARLLNLLAEHDRLGVVADLADAFHQRVLDHLQIVRAEVTTAVDLSTERAASLERSLAAATGKRVQVTSKVDPSIIGGVVARIGSRVYDGSVAHHLARVKARLIEAAQ
jgi:F-type H+-transporting ATPase subunit delta